MNICLVKYFIHLSQIQLLHWYKPALASVHCFSLRSVCSDVPFSSRIFWSGQNGQLGANKRGRGIGTSLTGTCSLYLELHLPTRNKSRTWDAAPPGRVVVGRSALEVQTCGSSALALPELCFLLISCLVCTGKCSTLDLGERRSNVHGWEGRGILAQMEEGCAICFTQMWDFTREVL